MDDITHTEVMSLPVNTKRLGRGHHILSRIERRKDGSVAEEHVIMWGGHEDD